MRRPGPITASLALCVLAGCGSSGTGSQHATGGTGTVTVFAAASLRETFSTLAKQYEATHPHTTVKLNFGASSALALQINAGAPADVFASASATNMTQVTGAGSAADLVTFARNNMEIVVPPSNPAAITGLRDLAKPGVKVALCQTQVPCGATAAKVFSHAGLRVKPVTLEADVKSTLTKVELNEVDAGVVYHTDVRTAGSKVRGIEIPAPLNASTDYPIAALAKAPNPAGARSFMAYVLSTEGQKVLDAAGFQKP